MRHSYRIVCLFWYLLRYSNVSIVKLQTLNQRLLFYFDIWRPRPLYIDLVLLLLLQYHDGISLMMMALSYYLPAVYCSIPLLMILPYYSDDTLFYYRPWHFIICCSVIDDCVFKRHYSNTLLFTCSVVTHYFDTITSLIRYHPTTLICYCHHCSDDMTLNDPATCSDNYHWQCVPFHSNYLIGCGWTVIITDDIDWCLTHYCFYPIPNILVVLHWYCVWRIYFIAVRDVALLVLLLSIDIIIIVTPPITYYSGWLFVLFYDILCFILFYHCSDSLWVLPSYSSSWCIMSSF